ncbi:MAG: helix-turn-helix domain-containing protein [Pseudomonadota bacterium]
MKVTERCSGGDGITHKRFESYNCSGGCPVEATLEIIGGKWKGVILFHLSAGTLRHSQFQRVLGSVSQRILTKQLRELKESGLVARETFPEVPPRVAYSLTDKGRSLAPVRSALKDWGEKNIL